MYPASPHLAVNLNIFLKLLLLLCPLQNDKLEEVLVKMKQEMQQMTK